MTNKEFSKENKNFNEACLNAGINPTKRQASKFRRGKGVAWKSQTPNMEKKE